ncbi:MAG: hypothetical protein ACI9US_004533 [Gammaproteobacteria bacterium]
MLSVFVDTSGCAVFFVLIALAIHRYSNLIVPCYTLLQVDANAKCFSNCESR